MIAPGATLGELLVTEIDVADAAMPLVTARTQAGLVVAARALVVDTHDPSVRSALSTFEARMVALSALSEPTLATAVAWSTNPVPFAAFARDLGGALTERLSQPRDARFACAVGVSVARALAAAHAAELVHGAVGPAAIRVADDGRVTLAELGIRELAARLAQHATQVLPDVVHSFAPEHARGGDATPASDVFALGATLFRILTGEYPFDGPSPLAVTLKLSLGRHEPLPPNVPESVRALVHRMLSADPTARPSAADALRELLHLAEHEDARLAIVRAVPSVGRGSPLALGAGVGFGDDVATELSTDVPEHLAAPDETALPPWIGGRAGQGFDDAPTECAPPPPADFELAPDPSLAPAPRPVRRRTPSPRPITASSGPSPWVYLAIGVAALSLIGLLVGLVVVFAG
ncbi:MAG: protein kinase [Sandaracinaceae bacterium]